MNMIKAEPIKADTDWNQLGKDLTKLYDTEVYGYFKGGKWFSVTVHDILTQEFGDKVTE